MKEKSNRKKNIFIIFLSIICLVIFTNMLFDTDMILLEPYKSGIKKYLEAQNYDDEFTDITFIETDDYVEKVGCAGTYYTDNMGKYYRYKVHAKKANIDFYVQYRTELYKERGLLTERCGIWNAVPGYEDNYIAEVAKSRVLKEFKEILGEEAKIRFEESLDEKEKGVIYWDFGMYLNIDVDKTLADSYNEDFLNKLKQISNPDLYIYNIDEFPNSGNVTINFADCKLGIYKPDTDPREMSISFRDNKNNEESLKQVEKNVQEWLYNNLEEYKRYIDGHRQNGTIEAGEYQFTKTQNK